jgi:hypothetical protein
VKGLGNFVEQFSISEFFIRPLNYKTKTIMKKLILIPILIMATVAVYGQIKKGALVGIHYGTSVLSAGVTQEQFNDFLLTKYIPASEKAFPGSKGYLVKGLRGDHENIFGTMWIFESEQVRNKYYNADGSTTEAGKAAQQKMQAVLDEFAKIATYTDKYTDWLVR